MNKDQENTQAALERAGISLHAMVSRHQPKVGHAVQEEFVAVYQRAANRLEFLQVIYKRLYETSHALNAIDAEMTKKFPNAETAGVPMSPEFVDIMDRVQDLAWTFQLDHDSMQIFGSLFLDDWALLVAFAQGLDRSQVGQFETLLNLLQGPQCPRVLQKLRDSPQSGVASYLCIAVRSFRNKLVVHQSKAWQRGLSRHSSAPLVFINYSVPEALLPLPEVIEADVKGIRTTFKLTAPADTSPQDLAAVVLGLADKVKTQSERQLIVKYVETYGVMNPLFQLIYHRLAEFINDASPLC